MKSLLFGSAVVAAAISLSSPSQAQGKKFALPPGAQKIEDGAYYLGRAHDKDGREVEGLAFIHPKAEAAKGGGGKPTAGSTCFALMSSGAKWKTIEPYGTDLTGLDPLVAENYAAIIETGFGAWEAASERSIFGAPDSLVLVNGADTAAPDNQNEFMFGPISDPGVIAVTIVWGRFSGPPRSRELVEWDMIFDNQEFVWGDATLDPSLMDFWNIFQHEAGHAAGLTHPSDTCTEETMYAYASNGETKKRDLHPGDVAGIRALYP